MYNKDIKFEWDPEKSHTNRLKHRIDFESAKSLWEDREAPVVGGLYDQRRGHSNYFSQKIQEAGDETL